MTAATPTISEATRHGTFWTIIALRALFFGAAIITLGSLIELGTSTTALIIAGASGTAFGSMLAFTQLRTRGFLTLCVAAYFLHQLFFGTVERLFASVTAYIFGTYIAELHFGFFLGIFALGALASWFFWRFKHWLTAEVVSFAAIAVYVLAGHRNYRFDTPRLINTIAWNFNVDELTVLVFCGSGLCISILVYLFVATLPSRPSPNKRLGGEAKPARTNWPAWIAALIGMGALFGFIAHEVYEYNWVAAGSRISNGVGESQSNSGLTPLGFHSALGATNQPSGVIRLEGDYRENPFTPMMYLREQALSDFNGREMVIADRRFDQDVSNTTPAESFGTDPDTTLGPRVPLRQSMYLLTEHKLAFAVDFPISMTPLKNPNPGRFKAAYQAYSMAPAFDVHDLTGAEVGDPRWDAATRAHYLVKHTDPRYQAMADSMTEGISDPMEKVKKFVDYINENTTYTLTPNHTVGADEDPVAPFLFGDMRGYCVHFAHAMVYLLRASGIPSRIGTGYLTDLSQAKDGHILLRMSDRHAWAEVYLAGKGWVPFDIQPAKVESHGESPVDQKLLEELMGSLEPPEEELSKEIAKHEPGMDDRKPFWDNLVPSTPVLLGLIFFGILLPFGGKSYLRYAWALPGTPEKKAIRTYRAVLSKLFDLGIRRREGETRLEFERRASSLLGITSLASTATINALRFAPPQLVSIKEAELRESLRDASEATRRYPLWIRCIAALNPSSVLSFCIGRKF